MYLKLKKLLRGLKIFFLYNYSYLLGKPLYPKIILPKTTYQSIVEFDELVNQFDLYIIRRAEFCKDGIFNEVGILKDDVLSRQDVTGLSMNLLGGLFKKEHTKFRAINNGAKEWNNEEVCLYKYLNDFSVVETWCPLVYKLQDLHNISIPL